MTNDRVSVSFDPGWRRLVPPAWTAAWNPERFDLGDGWTEVVVMGQGPPVLLLPPLPGYKESWLRAAPFLAARFRVVGFDLRARFAGPPSWEALIADLGRIADRWAPGRVAVVGHSLGGALAQRWAVAHPQRVRALVLSSTFARLENPASHWWLRYGEQPLVLASQRFLPRGAALSIARRLAPREGWVYDRHCDEAVLDFVRHGIRTLPLSDAARAVRLAFAHDSGDLSTWAGPTQVVVGELESAVAVRAATRLAERIPGAVLARIPETNHLHPLSRPDRFAEVVGDWLARQIA